MQQTANNSAPEQYPASKMYVFHQGWIVRREKTAQILALATQGSSSLFGLATILFEQNENFLLLLFGWTLGLLIALIGMAIFSVIALAALIFGLVFAILLLMSMAACLSLIGVLTLSSWLYSSRFGIHYRCPNAYCYYEMPAPLFLCNQQHCRRLHSALQPSTYGIFNHRCLCGNKLPTLDRLGRDKIDRLCTHCKTPLDKEIGHGTNIDIPIIGGRSAGKTTYMIASLSALKNFYHDHTIAFTNERYRKRFGESLYTLQTHQKLMPTQEEAPHAYSLTFAKPGVRVPKLLFFYDASGESFAINEKMYWHSYYKYIRGIVFIIDPCAISSFRRMHNAEIEAPNAGIFPSDLDVEEIGNRLIHNIEMRRGIRQFKPHKIPMAVVVTKVDALGLEEKIGLPAAQRRLEYPFSSDALQESMHTVVREFLYEHTNNLVDQLEHHFSPVRYFSCSSLGNTPNSSYYNFAPVRVLEPLQWILSENGVFKRNNGAFL